MVNKLNEQEISILTRFRLAPREEQSDLLIEMENFLLNDKEFSLYFALLKDKIGSPNDIVTASIFMKRYAFLAVISLYAMTAWNKRLKVDFDNIIMVSNVQEELWLPLILFKDLSYIEVKPGDNREKWREETVRGLFADHLLSIIDHLKLKTKISKYILWENIALYIFWLYETMFLDEKDSIIKERAAADFSYLVKEAPGELFGGYQKNPLMRYKTDPIFIPQYGKEVRVRKTCCFSCELMKNPKRCNTCPPKCLRLINGVEI